MSPREPRLAAAGDDASELRSAASRTEVAVDTGAAREGEERGARLALPEVLPVLPLKNTVLFPFLLSPLLVSSTRSKKLIDAVLLTPQRLLVCAAVRHPVEGSPGPDDVHRVMAAMLTISYSCAVMVPIVSGFVWDMTHIPTLAFVPIALCTFVLAGLALTFDFRSEKGWYVPKS